MNSDRRFRSLLGSFAAAAAAASALCGCSMFPSHKPPKPDPVVRRTLPPPTPRTDGAIYQAGQEMALFADLKARRVGDNLTIVLNEATAASKNAATTTSKTSAAFSAVMAGANGMNSERASR